MVKKNCCVLCLTPLFWGAVVAQTLSDENACHLVTFIPFTDLRPPPPGADNKSNYGYGSWPNASSLAKASFSLLVASEMVRMTDATDLHSPAPFMTQARDHFNARNSVIVPELDNLKDCPVKLGSTYMDSAYHRQTATTKLLEYSSEGNNTVCAVVGPADDHVAQGLSSLTEALKVPQLSYAANGYRLLSGAVRCQATTSIDHHLPQNAI